ncbi:anthranilate/aminodeoxychorismate synthase component II [Halorubrum sp. Ea1]|nr:anthranilate/aminodeoxychorismate synthase component II [Halorubrum sp. Eb13]OYR45121.1 anthranilate/aminodeoxychorismate synthase component II [Halorubrum sp. Hd13]OYR53027.1 anthranilate/aminodeoxychorismate synthase component II [Halorubrum sp. Ea8]OYR54447.1 anthranilate/aminodeoxychorismate synthase component II [Halorubrum sp. Ea1]
MDATDAADAEGGWRSGVGDSDARVLVVDNYDSFAYNLVQYVGEVAGAVAVRRNDAVDLDGIRALDPDGVVVSPGPGTPAEAGVSTAVFDLDRPVLGVCLGHQALCANRGSRVGHAPEVVHGKPSTITHDGSGVFAGLPDRLRVGRYHSLCVERADLPDEVVETARTEDEREVVMGVRHREKPHVGVQFHPESILTPRGKAMVANFVEACETHERGTADE